MRKILFVAAFCLLLGLPCRPQAQPSRVTVRAVLVDKDLNQKPVPHLGLQLVPETGDAGSPRETKTDFDGRAELQLPPGNYRLTTPQGVDFHGLHFTWDLEMNVVGNSFSVDLSNDNAIAASGATPQPSRKLEDLTQMFQKYQKSVVTVWSEIGSGTGFIVDSSGLIVTNQHVIGPSELNSVQFDSKRKVEATVLAFDADRDIAILYADLSEFSGATAAATATARPGQGLAVEGERVFTIGSPLGLKKIIASGIVSRVEARAIISDVNINHGNSGGPLFNSLKAALCYSALNEKDWC